MKENIISLLKQGKIGILKTDTLYGILGLAKNKETVERIYKIKGRNKEKPFIILISSVNDLKKFNIKINKNTKKILEEYWPGKVSIILPCTNKKFEYLHRGKKSLAFRLPAKKELQELIKKTGSLVAPSANPEGKKPAESIKQAKKYFGEIVDFYEYGRGGSNKASKLIEVVSEEVKVLRG